MAGTQSTPIHITPGASGYRRGCRCDDCRAGIAAKMRADYARRRAEGKPAGSFRVIACQNCGVHFNSRQRAGLYASSCSKRCANIARNSARGFHPRPPRKSNFRKRAEKVANRAAVGTSGKKLWVQGACAVCAESFLSPGAQSRYCSPSCKRKYHSCNSFGVSWLDRMALFARDFWTCQICSEPVDYSAEPSSDWYPTLDHIVPRSRGGSNEFSNLRTAHHWCNSVRGDLSYYTDADLNA